MKQIISSKHLSSIIFILSILVIVKVIWIIISLLFLPKQGEEFVTQSKAKALYYRVKLTNESAVIAPVATSVKKVPIVNSMRGIKLLALYNSSDTLVVTVSKGNKTKVLGKGEKIDGFTLTSAGSDYAMFTKGGKEFKLALNNIKNKGKSSNSAIRSSNPSQITENRNQESDEVIEEEDGRKIISRTLLTSYTQDVDKIWKDIGINENKVNGKLSGFKINYVKKGSDFEKLGLKSGDLLMAINAEELNSYGTAMNFFKDIKNIENLTLTVERNGKTEEIDYEIK